MPDKVFEQPPQPVLQGRRIRDREPGRLFEAIAR